MELVEKYRNYKVKDEALERLYRFTTTEISDGLGGNNVMENAMKPIDQIGRASCRERV